MRSFWKSPQGVGSASTAGKKPAWARFHRRNPYKNEVPLNGKRVDNFRRYVCLTCGAIEEHSFAPGTRKHVMCSANARVLDENGVPFFCENVPCWYTMEDLHGLGIDPDLIPVVYAMGGPAALKAVIDEHRERLKESLDQVSEPGP